MIEMSHPVTRREANDMKKNKEVGSIFWFFLLCLAVIGFGTAFVGINEEMTFRGVVGHNDNVLCNAVNESAGKKILKCADKGKIVRLP